MARHIPKPHDAADLDPLAAKAYTTILDRIVRLDLPPGSLISENSLGREMGLSRTPVREALKRLEREYLVSIMPRRGIVVTEVDLRSQIQLLEMRRGLEMRLLLRGAERASDGQRDEMKRLASEMETAAKAGDLESYVRLDAEFDCIIEEACGNRFLTQAMWPVHALVRRYWHTQVGTADLLEALEMHVRVVRAATDGDLDALRQRLTELCDRTQTHILDQMR
ncbi:GntR family transcriptional regulator [Roseovarius sp. TE539]|uniref:GntR family transcriptional regulator n=1 Tax=Roseovarius sp. TE539 TaxID=2249812 RepID=UPI0015EF883A|nr:GntR family transcriptional regulator [Roseovarius sp. TE539]